MGRAGLYSLGFLMLFGGLFLGGGFVIWDALHDRGAPPKPVLADGNHGIS
jgi:hypothetical protein